MTNGVCIVNVLDSSIKALKYIDENDDKIWPVIVRHFPRNNYILTRHPFTEPKLLKKSKMTNKFSIFWPARSVDLNIIKNIWLTFKC